MQHQKRHNKKSFDIIFLRHFFMDFQSHFIAQDIVYASIGIRIPLILRKDQLMRNIQLYTPCKLYKCTNEAKRIHKKLLMIFSQGYVKPSVWIHILKERRRKAISNSAFLLSSSLLKRDRQIIELIILIVNEITTILRLDARILFKHAREITFLFFC